MDVQAKRQAVTEANFSFINTKSGALTVRALLCLTILVSPIVYVEPSPYEGMVFVLAIVAFSFGLKIPRYLVLLLFLVTVWAMSGFIALLPAFNDAEAVRYYVISVYLMSSAIVFTCIMSNDSSGRVSVLVNSYLVAGVGIGLVAIAAFFGLIPNDFLVHNGRATGTFKDPNVFAPYLILPTLYAIQALFFRGVSAVNVVGVLTLIFAIFLAFSRGAWGNLAFSGLVMILFLALISPSRRFRRRMLMVAGATVIALSVLIAIALSIPAVHEMFTIRAELLQSYDWADSNSRFGRQWEAIWVALSEPNGLGPYGFAHQYGEDIHNVYLNVIVTYGWAGAFAYLGIVCLTIINGISAMMKVTPWQSYLPAVNATFIGLVGEGMIIDTDHWRHFFLLIGLIWGLSGASHKYRRERVVKLSAVDPAVV